LSFLRTLSVQHLRNLNDVSIDLSHQINVFYGDNGSGKTSILEAVALVGLGRSFRSHKTRSLVNHQEIELTVFTYLDVSDTGGGSIPVGLQKSRNGTGAIRVSGETIRSAAILAKQLPLLIINAGSFQLIEGSPVQRRQFLDWLVFHVKPNFSEQWRGLQKTLKQRNSLLRRDKISRSDIKPWDNELARLSQAIDAARSEVFLDLIECFEQFGQEFTVGQLNIEMEYYRGWDKELTIEAALENDFERDCRDGYTHQGPQRADIKIRSQKKPAVDVLSRGQEKSLVCALTIAQAYLYQQSTEGKCVFLIDDLLAELDKQHVNTLAKWLTELNVQVLVAGVNKDDLLAPWNRDEINVKTFHVKHGEVDEI
jgi:DNA replication and repair protein RecF